MRDHTCVTTACPQVPGEPSHLLYGDDNGDVHVMTFVNPCTHLFVADTRKSSGVSPRISYNVSVDLYRCVGLHDASLCK